jgi:hypothetical protein
MRTFVAAIRAGNYAIVAAQAAGVHPSTFFNWMKRGAVEKDGIFRELFDAVKKAEAEGEATLVGIVRKAAPKNWQAAMTILERKYPKRWARWQRPDESAERPLDREPTVDDSALLNAMTDEEIASLAEMMERAKARLKSPTQSDTNEADEGGTHAN